MSKRSMIVALDQGTTSTRAIVFDAGNLEPLFTSQREFPQHYPDDGWVEHDLNDIWNDVEHVLGESKQWIGANDGVAISLGITNQRETVALWDRKSGEPLHRAIVWQDRRTADRCAQLKQDGMFDLVNGKTGLVLDPYFSSTKMAWLLDNAGEGLRERAAKADVLLGTIDSFLVWRLTGGKVFATDVTNASRTQLCNLATMEWDDELLELHGVPRACLPEIRDCAADFGTTDLLGEPVLIGGIAGDQQAAALGQACLAAGEAKSTYGTGCFLIVQGGSETIIPGSGLLGTVGYRVGQRKAYAVEGSIFVAGVAVKWLRDKLGLVTTAQETASLAQGAADSGTYLVPAFTGLGAPHWQPEARAALVGMTLDTDKAQIVRATLASIAYATVDLVDAFAKEDVNLNRINIDGGMSVNDWFAQYLADMVNLPVSRPRCTETTAVGAAFLAGLQAGHYSSLDDISSLRVEERSFAPSMEGQTREALLAGWQKAVQAVLELSSH